MTGKVGSLKRVKLRFTKDVEIEFVDRDRAIDQINKIADRGTRFPLIIYGPEGCGKTALFKQAKEILEEHNYNVVYASPLAERESEVLSYTPSIKDIVKEVLKIFPKPYSEIVDASITIASRVMKRLRRPKVALLMDDIFQAVGLDNAEKYVKILLNLIEYPPGDYENVVVFVSSSEGVTRSKIGRHNWTDMRILWNMSREGFEELYNVMPSSKPSFEEVWNLLGGNPRYLGRLYERNWSVEGTINDLIKLRGLDEQVSSFDSRMKELLSEIIEDPDVIFYNLRDEQVRKLRDMLVELNLIIRVWDRDEYSWIDVPPPEKDIELGIGRYYAWQTPLHKEAVKKVLENSSYQKV